MKQSKKLLSIFLAMLMLLGTVSVIGNAGYQKAQMAYDSVDNPAPTADQVANLVLDVVDELLADLDFNENYVVVKINLTSVDAALETVYGFNGVKGIAGGDIANLDVSACKNVTRSGNGDIGVIYALLEFIYDNADVLSKAAYGIGTKNGLDLGWLIDLIGLDLGDIGTILEDIPGFLTKTVYDMLIYGSYGPSKEESNKYSKDAEEWGTLPAEVDSLDEIVNVAINGLLTKPQNYEYVDGEKVWDENSYILKSSDLVDENGNALDLSLLNNSVFSLINKALQVAYESFGVPFINNDLKRNFMRMMGADFITLDDVADKVEIDNAKKDADYIDVAKASADKVALVKNYLCNAQMWKVGDTWYYRGYKTVDKVDAEGNVVTDEEGNVVTIEKDVFQRVDMSYADSLFSLINWDYNLTADSLNFNTMIPKYGSIIGSLNHILYVVLSNAINFEELGITIADIWDDGDNSKFNENLMKTAKYLLTNFTFKFFGRNEAYVDLYTLEAKPEFIAKINSFKNDVAADREGLIAYMLLPFLGDALPQLVYDVDMFDAGLQIEQVAVLLVREFLSDLTPQINYDDQIFTDATLKTGRKFQTKTSAQWIELLLNMGLDLGATYLDNICNIGMDLAAREEIKGYAVAAGDPAYMGLLEEIVDYAVNYIGKGETSVLVGCEPAKLGSVRCITAYDYKTDKVTVANNYAGNAFDMLSTVLNNLLPLGILCNVSSDKYALDVKMVFDRLIDVIDDFDLEVLLGTFGQNNHKDNFLYQTNIVDQLLKLVNKLVSCILGFNLFPVTSSLNGAVTQANLKTIVANLLKSLYNRRLGLIPNALPIVAAFVDDWGSEQAMRSPTLSIDNVTYASNGSLNYTVTLTNGSRGIWRGYMENGARVQDEQYAYNVQSIASAQGITVGSGYTGKLDYGASKTFTLTGTIPAAGLGDRLDISYQVYDESGNLMDGGKSYSKAYFTYYAYDSNEWNHLNDDSYEFFVKKALVFGVTPDENGKLQATDAMKNIGNEDTAKFYHSKSSNGKSYSLEMQSQPGNGFTTNNSKLEEDADKEKDYWIKAVSFNEGNYTAPDAAAGQTLSFNYKFYSWYKKTIFSDNTYCGWHEDANSNFPTSYIKIYDEVAMDQLRELVNTETGLNRRPETYKAEGDYNGYLGTLANAIMVAWNPGIDGSFQTDSTTVRLALEAAVKKLEAAKMTPAEQAAAGLDTVDAAIADLETAINGIKAGLGGKDYRTHMLYRWSRYQSALSDANRAFNLQREYEAGLATQKFEYNNSMYIKELNALISGNAYESYIKALYVDLDEEELAAAQKRYSDVTREYGGYTTLDIAQIKNLATRMSQRLLPREGGVVNTYLSKEIESAKAVIGNTNTNNKYSDKSWAVYATALSNAEAAMTSASQDTIFNAKYQLQVARNSLVTKENEASYDELETLKNQAVAALAQPKGTYVNSDAELGAVLAALGHEVKDASGNTIQLFPDSAMVVLAKSYDKHDQDEIDDAADALKTALAKLQFASFKPADSEVTIERLPTGEEGENGSAILEELKTKNVAKEQSLSAVKSLVKVSSEFVVEVSLDNKYTAEQATEGIFVGTGATITVFKKDGDVKIPVASIKVVVDGDVNGDGTIDVLDCMAVELATNGHTSFTGAYNAAANLVSDVNDTEGVIDANDLREVVNIARGK